MNKIYNTVLELFREYPKTSKILDVGCGEAKFHSVLKQHGYKNVVGFDMDIAKIEEAEKNNPSYEYYVFDACKPYQFNDDSFDVVLSMNVLEHVYCPKLMINEILHVVNNSGCCVLCTPNGLRVGWESTLFKSNSIHNGVFQYTTPSLLHWTIRELGGHLIYLNLSSRIPPFLRIYSKFICHKKQNNIKFKEVR